MIGRLKANSMVLGGAMTWVVLVMACAPVEQKVKTQEPALGPVDFVGSLHETPAPDGAWRGHHLKECQVAQDVPRRVENLLALSAQFFREGSGSDGMIELEMALEEGVRHGLIDLTLAQLYLLAGQGEPALLPNDGPAADVGNWKQNKKRLLNRARTLLYRAQAAMPHDGIVDHLLADVARAENQVDLAADFSAQAQGKCMGGRTMTILRQYQQLNRYPARFLGGAVVEYSEDALARGVSGDVTLDLLLDPSAQIRQAVVLDSPDAALTRSALKALRESNFEAARVGKYPVWAWLQVTIAFNLDN